METNLVKSTESNVVLAELGLIKQLLLVANVKRENFADDKTISEASASNVTVHPNLTVEADNSQESYSISDAYVDSHRADTDANDKTSITTKIVSQTQRVNHSTDHDILLETNARLVELQSDYIKLDTIGSKGTILATHLINSSSVLPALNVVPVLIPKTPFYFNQADNDSSTGQFGVMDALRRIKGVAGRARDRMKIILNRVAVSISSLNHMMNMVNVDSDITSTHSVRKDDHDASTDNYIEVGGRIE